MSAAERLQLVIVPFIGVDKIDVPAATELGVLVANSPTPENFVAVAEATIALSSSSARRWGWSASAAWARASRGGSRAGTSD
jgi:D-3-phosphoglycerate dehydrogenase